MHLPKGAEVEEREVSRFTRYSLMIKVTQDTPLFLGNVDDITIVNI